MRSVATIYLLFLFYTSSAQYNYSFSVFDTSGKRLGHVLIKNGEGKAHTDSLGNAAVVTSLPIQTFTFSHPDYETIKRVCVSDVLNQVILQPALPVLPEARVYSFESNTGAFNVAASVAKLSSNELERFSNTSLVTAVNTVPGVKMDERSPGSYRISIRGNLQRSAFGIRNVKIYWNGLPFTDANGTTYLNQVVPDIISNIEILKGPGSSMYGAGTSGVMLMRSENHTPGFSSMIAAGSFGLLNMNAAYTVKNKTGEHKASLTHTRSDGYRRHSAMKRSVFHISSNTKLTPGKELMINCMYSRLNYETPGALTESEMRSDPRSARPAAGNFPGAGQQQAALYLGTIYSGVSLSTLIGSYIKNITGVYFSQTNFRNPAIRNYEIKKEHGGGGRTVFNFQKDYLKISAGSEFQSGFANTATYGNRYGVIDTLQYHHEITSRQYNIFLQGEYRLQSFLFTMALSHNNYYYGFREVNFSGETDKAAFTPVLMPRFSILFKAGKGLNLYASFGKGYSPPSIDEVHASDGNFNRSIYAEQSSGYETGLKGRFGKTAFEANVYLLNLQNTIVARRDSSGAEFYVNSGKTKQSGFELFIRNEHIKKESGLVRMLATTLTWSWISARFKDYKQGNNDFSGNRLTGTPQHVFYAGVECTAAFFYLNAGYSYTGKIPLNDASTFYGNAYNQLFLKAGYRLPLKYSPELFVTMDRSFNNPYGLGHDLNAAANRYFNPSAPMIFTAGIKTGGIK